MPALSILNRMKIGMTLGPIAGIGQVFFILYHFVVAIILDLVCPRKTI